MRRRGKNARPRSTKELLRESFFAAARMNDVVKMAELVSCGAFPCGKLNGVPIVMAAARYGSVEALEFLLEMGADISASDGLDGVLHSAAASGNEFVLLKSIDSSRGDLNVAGRNGTPLMHAVRHRKSSCALILLNAGANPNARGRCGKTAAHAAAETGSSESLRILAEYEADMEAYSSCGYWTPLAIAVSLGKEDATRELLRIGANPNVIGIRGRTPLHLAASRGNAVLTKLLLENGSDWHAEDSMGATALRLSLQRGNDARSAEELLACGAKLGDEQLSLSESESKVLAIAEFNFFSKLASTKDALIKPKVKL